MPKRWSKLQSRLYNLMDPSVGFQLHCAVYKINGNGRDKYSFKLPRYWAIIENEIVFDYPKDFDMKAKYGVNQYPWDNDISYLSNLIEDYIQCPESELMKGFANDSWGITDVLLVCDRRIGKRKLRQLEETIQDEKLLKVITKRLGEQTTS